MIYAGFMLNMILIYWIMLINMTYIWSLSESRFIMYLMLIFNFPEAREFFHRRKLSKILQKSNLKQNFFIIDRNSFRK